MFVFDSGRLERPRYIINFPTKDHWRSRSRLADIETGLADLRRVFSELEIESVALLLLGCGLGGLDWSDVRPRIEAALADLSVRAVVFEPQGVPAPEQMAERRPRPRMTPFRATLIWLLGRYLSPGESASPLEVQKLLYFLQEAGEPLGLTFEKQRYGPYADAARHAVQDLEGHGPHEAAELVRVWSQRKGRLFTDDHVDIAWQRLDEGGWLAGTRVTAGV